MRGTTPTHTFSNLGVDLTNARVYLTYAQYGNTVLEKTNEDMTIGEDSISVKLTQQESLLFSVGKVQMQIRFVMQDGTAGKSDIIEMQTSKLLKEGVIEWQ